VLDDSDTRDDAAGPGFDGRPLSAVIQEVERQYICAVLNAANGNKSQAARLAGLTYQTFIRKLNALNLRVTYHAE
jgi:DNA-binding NtrC family response regulator